MRRTWWSVGLAGGLLAVAQGRPADPDVQFKVRGTWGRQYAYQKRPDDALKLLEAERYDFLKEDRVYLFGTLRLQQTQRSRSAARRETQASFSRLWLLQAKFRRCHHGPLKPRP